MTPEHFVNHVCYSLEANKESIKLLVLDEATKCLIGTPIFVHAMIDFKYSIFVAIN